MPENEPIYDSEGSKIPQVNTVPPVEAEPTEENTEEPAEETTDQPSTE